MCSWITEIAFDRILHQPREDRANQLLSCTKRTCCLMQFLGDLQTWAKRGPSENDPGFLGFPPPPYGLREKFFDDLPINKC